MVGAVLVRDGKVIKEGFHSEFGKEHAERQLLEKFDQKISSLDILYVNLEPCCHTGKKTPPCAQLLIEKGIKHLVFGMLDPNPKVGGEGIELLRKSGIEVIGPILEDGCLRLNRGFVSVQKNNRPWITVKIARTVDGRFANEDGSMMKITSDTQNQWSHEFLRARHDAILVGVNTIITDNSQLTVRALTPGPSPDGRGETFVQNFRIILDAQLTIPLEARVVNSSLSERTIVITAPDADVKKMKELQSKGVRIFEVPLKDSVFDWTILWKKLITPDGDFYGIKSILVEGGPKTWEIFKKAGMVDEEVMLVG